MSTPIPHGQGATPEQADQIAKHANNGRPAFPIADPFSVKCPSTDEEALRLRNGMTLREYAAIKLRVPESGTDWLDEMIRKSVRDEFAAKAMQAYISLDNLRDDDLVALCSYGLADTMLRERETA